MMIMEWAALFGALIGLQEFPSDPPDITTAPTPPRITTIPNPDPPDPYELPPPGPPMPQVDQMSFFAGDIYPRDALENEYVGRTHSSLFVDNYGKPVACFVDQSSGAATLDRETCQILLRNMRFDPGRDQFSIPEAALWEAQPIGWRLDGLSGANPSNADARFRARLDAAGLEHGERLELDFFRNAETACTFVDASDKRRPCTAAEAALGDWLKTGEFRRRMPSWTVILRAGSMPLEDFSLPQLIDPTRERVRQYDHAYAGELEEGGAFCIVPLNREELSLPPRFQWGSRLCDAEESSVIFGEELELILAPQAFEFRYFMVSQTLAD